MAAVAAVSVAATTVAEALKAAPARMAADMDMRVEAFVVDRQGLGVRKAAGDTAAQRRDGARSLEPHVHRTSTLRSPMGSGIRSVPRETEGWRTRL
jgi:hypothetical protein